MSLEQMSWASIPIGPESVVARALLRTRRETDHERWVRRMNEWHPEAMDTRGRRNR